MGLYCIVLYLLPVLNPKSYDGARVLEASGRPMLVIGRSYWFVSIQEVDDAKGKDGITVGTETAGTADKSADEAVGEEGKKRLGETERTLVAGTEFCGTSGGL